MVNLERLQARFARLSTAKGACKVYNRLKWPNDGPETQKSIQTIQRSIQVFHMALTLDGRGMLSQTSEKASEMLRASQRYVCSRLLLVAS